MPNTFDLAGSSEALVTESHQGRRWKWLIGAFAAVVGLLLASALASVVWQTLFPAGFAASGPLALKDAVRDLVDDLQAGRAYRVERAMGRNLTTDEFERMRKDVTPFPAAGVGRVDFEDSIITTGGRVEYHVSVSTLNLHSTALAVFVFRESGDRWYLQQVRRADFSGY